ncbi:MAG: RNA-binding domain-containing protein [Promethearchaeota archaeon]
MKDANFVLKSIEFTTHVHATEDLDKVKQAVLFLLPENLRSKIELKVKKVIGHWNNPIHLIEAKHSDAENAMLIIKYLMKSLNDEDKNVLREGLDRRIEKSHLYLRFDKQAAFNERLKIKDEDDVIRLKVTFVIYPSPTHDKLKSICENLLMN